MMTTRLCALAMVGALGAGAGCAQDSSEQNQAAQPAAVATATVAPQPPAPPALDTRTLGWAPGVYYEYALRLSATVSFGNGAKGFDFDLAGTLRVTPATATAEETTLYLGIADPKFVSRVQGSQSQFDKVAADIRGTGCFVTLSGGRVTADYLRHGLNATAANVYRDVAAALQFARAADGAPQYTAEEYDTTGQYIAEYQFEPDHSLWLKHKQRYTAILAANSAPAGTPSHVVPEVRASEGDVAISPDGRPIAVHMADEVALDSAQVPVRSKSKLSLEGGTAHPAQVPTPDWSAMLGAMDRIDAKDPYGSAATIESLDKARINGKTFETTVSELESMARTKHGPVVSSVNGAAIDPDEQAARQQSTDERARLFIALAAILREQPDKVPLTVKKIQTGSPAAEVLVQALSSAGSPAAQSALVELVNSKALEPRLRDRIVLALSRTPKPDAKSVDALKAMLKADPFSEEALLGLGSYSRRLRDAGEMLRAEDIGRLLVATLAQSRGPSDRVTILRAITNSGYTPAKDVVVGYTTAPEEEIRVAAVRALQSMKDGAVDHVIADRMLTDSSSAVQISAIAAAKVRDPSDVLAHAVASAASSAADPHVRYRAVELIGFWAHSRPELRATLEDVSVRDPEGRIRERAKAAL